MGKQTHIFVSPPKALWFQIFLSALLLANKTMCRSLSSTGHVTPLVHKFANMVCLSSPSVFFKFKTIQHCHQAASLPTLFLYSA